MAKRAQIIPPRPDLKRKAVNFSKGFDLKLPPEVLQKLETVVHKSQDKFTADIAERLTAMRRSIAQNAADSNLHPYMIKALSDASREIKGAGGTIGFDLLTYIGKSLNDFLDGMVELSARQMEVCTLHIDAMSVVLANRITGAGGAVEAELLRAFDEACAKFREVS